MFESYEVLIQIVVFMFFCGALLLLIIGLLGLFSQPFRNKHHLTNERIVSFLLFGGIALAIFVSCRLRCGDVLSCIPDFSKTAPILRECSW